MKASITHFCEVVQRIEANSWWAANIGGSPRQLRGFTYRMDGNGQTITEVPTEPLESLLLHVRKLTMNDAPEQLLKLKKALKGEAKASWDQKLLDVWQKHWRLAFVTPQFMYENGTVKEFMTPYRVYDCFITYGSLLLRGVSGNPRATRSYESGGRSQSSRRRLCTGVNGESSTWARPLTSTTLTLIPRIALSSSSALGRAV